MIAIIILTIALVISICTVGWLLRINKKLLTTNARLLNRHYSRRVVIAGNFQQGQMYMKAFGMNPSEVHVVSNGVQLRGMADVDILWCGTYREHRNYPELVEQVRQLRALGYVHSEIMVPELDRAESVRPSHG